MLMGLFSTWPWWLIDVPFDNDPNLHCRPIVDDILDGFSFASVVNALMMLLVVLYPSQQKWSWIDDVVSDWPLCG